MMNNSQGASSFFSGLSTLLGRPHPLLHNLSDTTHIHFTPTYSSWINQVEIWFNIITQKAIRRGSFSSVRQLVDKIRYFTDAYNPQARPFLWTATADSILQKIQRLCTAISGTRH